MLYTVCKVMLVIKTIIPDISSILLKEDAFIPVFIQLCLDLYMLRFFTGLLTLYGIGYHGTYLLHHMDSTHSQTWSLNYESVNGVICCGTYRSVPFL